MTDMPLLSVVLLLPLAGAVLLSVVSKDSDRTIRLTALGFSTATFFFSLAILQRFSTEESGFQLTEKMNWIPSTGASYHLGVDGISLWLVLLTTLLTPLSLLASWKVTKRVKAFHIVMLVTETAMLGVFLALDLLLFYVFWEGMLIPMYLLIGVWGAERRIYAAVKFFIYTLAGSLLMLAGLIAVYFLASQSLGHVTFDITELSRADFPVTAQYWLFAAFFLSFAIKVPIFPFHTWLPDAHTEAPTAGSVLLAGVLLKMGAYGFLRFSFPFFPDASLALAPALAVLGVIGIVYGGVVCVIQKDIKRLIAYSSVSHLGFVVLGISALTVLGATGSVIQMVNHGLSTGALFLLVGMLYERAHTREISEMSGLNALMPLFGGLFLLVSLSSLGLPGLNGFVGEFMILSGSFVGMRTLAAIGAVGIVLAAIYLLWSYERIFMGKTRVPHGERQRVWRDMNLREVAVLTPLVILIIWIGVYPKPFLDRIEPSVARVVEAVTEPHLEVAGR